MLARDPVESATTALGEAVEQAADGLSSWCRAVAELIEDDVNRVANGEYHVADLASAGMRLLEVNVCQLLQMAKVASDNMALLSSDATVSDDARRRAVPVVITVPAASEVTLACSSLKGEDTGARIPTE